MEKGSFQALLLEGEYYPQYIHTNPAVDYHHSYDVAQQEPYDKLPGLWSIEQLKNEEVIRDKKRVKTTSSSYKEINIRGRERRHTISEKLRCLQKLLPCDRKMDTGTMLEEANKYVRFLQAQVSVLQSMPLSDHRASAQLIRCDTDMYGAGLGRLSRQQLLEVVLSSNVAQKLMYTQGCCVYTSEQLALLQRVVA